MFFEEMDLHRLLD